MSAWGAQGLAIPHVPSTVAASPKMTSPALPPPPERATGNGAGAILRSRRLSLRLLTRNDAPRIARLAGDWDIASMTARIPYPYTETDALHWIEGLAEGEAVLGVERDRLLIGLCGYRPLEEGAAEIGYWIGKPWWGRGYATEAAGAVVEHCFRHLGFSRLICCHFIDNPASGRVIAKLGFTPTGRVLIWCDARRAEVEAIRCERWREEG